MEAKVGPGCVTGQLQVDIFCGWFQPLLKKTSNLYDNDRSQGFFKIALFIIPHEYKMGTFVRLIGTAV